MKRVKFLNREFKVRDNMLYMAANADGMVCAYSKYPEWSPTLKQWTVSGLKFDNTDMQVLGMVDLTEVVKI